MNDERKEISITIINAGEVICCKNLFASIQKPDGAA
jgi:hypothetical protein